MQGKQIFELQKERTFGEVLSDTFLFIRLYSGPISKCFAGLVLPFVAINAAWTASGHISAERFFKVLILDLYSLYQKNIIISCVLTALTILMTIVFITDIFKILAEGKTPTFQNVSRKVKSDFVKAAGIFFGYIIILPIFLFPLALSLYIPIGKNNPNTFLIYYLMCAVIFAYINIRLSLIYTMGILEDKVFFAAIAKSWVFTKKRFWQTAGLLVFFILLFYPIQLLLEELRKILLNTYDSQNRIIYRFLADFFLSALKECRWVIISIGLTLQYFNIAERKGHAGLIKTLDEIGKTTKNQSLESFDEESV